MATITYDGDAPGRGGSGPIFSGGSGVQKVVTGKFSFDNSYPTGGEDISDIFAQFNSVTGVSRLQGLLVENPMTSSGTGKRTRVDYSAKKLMLYDNAVASAEVSNGTDQSNATNLRFIAWGPR